MAKRKQKPEKKDYIDDNGFTYNLRRSPLDYFDHKDFFNEVISEYDIETLKALKKEKNVKNYMEHVRILLDEAERVQVGYFQKYTKRVQTLVGKIYKKEEHIIKILKSSTFDTATTDIRKIKSLLDGIKELAYKLSSEYIGDSDA